MNNAEKYDLIVKINDLILQIINFDKELDYSSYSEENFIQIRLFANKTLQLIYSNNELETQLVKRFEDISNILNNDNERNLLLEKFRSIIDSNVDNKIFYDIGLFTIVGIDDNLLSNIMQIKNERASYYDSGIFDFIYIILNRLGYRKRNIDNLERLLNETNKDFYNKINSDIIENFDFFYLNKIANNDKFFIGLACHHIYLIVSIITVLNQCLDILNNNVYENKNQKFIIEKHINFSDDKLIKLELTSAEQDYLTVLINSDTNEFYDIITKNRVITYNSAKSSMQRISSKFKEVGLNKDNKNSRIGIDVIKKYFETYPELIIEVNKSNQM